MLHAAMLGLMSLSVLLAIIGSNGGVWSVNELENNRFFNGTIYFGLTEFYTEGNFDESVFPGPHDIVSCVLHYAFASLSSYALLWIFLTDFYNCRIRITMHKKMLTQRTMRT